MKATTFRRLPDGGGLGGGDDGGGRGGGDGGGGLGGGGDGGGGAFSQQMHVSSAVGC